MRGAGVCYHVGMSHAAFLNGIRMVPEDDIARLVYADFVEEEGDPARGEFIRVQVALARTPESEPARRTLEDREHALLAEYGELGSRGQVSVKRPVGPSEP